MISSRASKRGFTLIELLVVIAIIGVLSSIVLSSLNRARSKGSDAAAKSNLDNARAQAQLFYDSNNNRFVITPGSATDVCSVSGSVGSPAVKGVFGFVAEAARASGYSAVNNTITVTGGAGVVTCHACFTGQASTDCTTEGRWAAEVPLRGTPGFVYCVDSSGTASTTTTTLGSGDTRCAG
ncbi:MAG: putative Type IV pilus pilin [Parcubacteria bacterium C7867-007]|nr:MAG: putative Type IV pilus pilin [Parcubacteria bacterium C7867-007]